MNALKRYGAVQSETASPERVMVLLFEAAQRHMRAGVTALEQGRAREAITPLTKASDIVSELQRSLEPTRAPALTEQLAQVYTFVCQRLLLATVRKDVAMAREAEKVFAPLVQAFAGAVAKVNGGAK